MNAIVEQDLIAKIRALSPQQRAEVENFVEFLAHKSQRLAAIEAVGLAPLGDDAIAAEVKAGRA